jgi:hypothetical protein
MSVANSGGHWLKVRRPQEASSLLLRITEQIIKVCRGRTRAMAAMAHRGKLAVRAIFVSYRRDDSEGEAGRLFADLVNQFGDASVFMDVAAIQPGRDFRKAIDESVSTCGVLLAIIGKNWVEAKNEAGERRLDNPFDFVRLETASALKRDIPVIPVLVRGARMPHPDELPDDLKDLAYRNCCELTHARWGSDLQLLIRALRAYVDNPNNAADLAPKGVGGGAAVQPAPGPAQYERESDQTAAITGLSRWKSQAAICTIVLIAVVTAVLAAYKLLTPKATGHDHLVVGRETKQQDAEKTAPTVLSESPPTNARLESETAVGRVTPAQHPPTLDRKTPSTGVPARKTVGAKVVPRLAEETPQSLPNVMHFCAQHCTTLIWDNGHYTNASDPGNAIWTVESFTRESIIIHRVDYRPYPLTSVYTGQMSSEGNSIINTNHAFKLTWGTALDSIPGRDPR